MSAKNMNSTPDGGDGQDGQEAPLDPAVERVRRKMMRLMGISVAIMMVGLMAVFGAIFYKISTPSQKNGLQADQEQILSEQSRQSVPSDTMGSDISASIVLPQGSTVIDTKLSAGQILLNVKSAQGVLSLWVYDIVSDRVTAKIVIVN